MEPFLEPTVDSAVVQQPALESKKPKGKETREKKPRVERKNEYEYNADLITEDTIIPALPKKADILPKPEMADFKERETKNREKINKLIQKKKQIREQKFNANHKFALKGDGSKRDMFHAELNDVTELQERFNEIRAERNLVGDDLHLKIEEAKENNKFIKEYRGSLKGSRQNFFERLQELEHTLQTADLTKQEEKSLNVEITEVKRKIRDAESSGHIEIKLSKCEDRKEELDIEIDQLKARKNPLDEECNKLKALIDAKRKHIDETKVSMNEESKEKNEEREKKERDWEQWKEEKSKRLDRLEEEIKKILAENNRLWDDYNTKKDEYWKQKQLIDFVEWQAKIKARKINDKEREKRRLEMESREQEQKLAEQRQKYLKEIGLCNFLIEYCQGLKPVVAEAKVVKEVSAVSVATVLTEDAQWKKEKGLVVLPSKKSYEDEEPQKKYKKQKKPKEVKEEGFKIPFAVQAQFESIKILAPASLQEVDAKINELREREALFIRACANEASEEEGKLIAQIKEPKGQKGKQSKQAFNEEEFPSL